MKVSCLQENLAKGLSIVGRAVSTRSTLPVLANVLLATDNGRLKLSATNLEISITCWIGARVDEEGSITVPARTFNDLVSALPPETVEMMLDPQTLTLHMAGSRSEANIKGIDAQEFPLIPEPDYEDQSPLRLETETLIEMIGQVAFAAATDDARPTLTGVLTRFEAYKMTMAATDGFRLSVRSAALPIPIEDKFEVVIPARALMEVARIADSDEISVSMREGRNQVIFDMENVVLVSQLIDGNFPDFSPVIPQGYQTRTILNTAEFSKACKMAEIFAREANQTARVRVDPGNELMPGYAEIMANSQETGDNVAQIDASVDGDQIEIAFNVRYMTQVLNVLNTPQVALETNTASDPGVIKPVGSDEFVHIIMPMHFGR